MASRRPSKPPKTGAAPPTDASKGKRRRKKHLCSCVKYCQGRPTPRWKDTYFRHRALEKIAATAKAVADGLLCKRRGSHASSEVSQEAARAAKRARPLDEAEEDEDIIIPAALIEPPKFEPGLPSRSLSPAEPPPENPFADPPQAEPRPRATVEDNEEDAADLEPAGAVDDGLEEVPVTLEDMKRTLDFIKLLTGANLDSPRSGLSPEACEQLRNPPEELLEIDDDDHLYSIELYLDLHNASQECYKNACAIVGRRQPERKLLSVYQVKRKLDLLTGKVPIVTDMCVGSCVAFAGSYRNLDACPKCQEPRYDVGLRDSAA